MRTLLLAGALVFLPAAALGQDEPADLVDRFELFTNCSSLWLLVEGLPDAALDMGLTKESVERTARSRLRAARIYHGDEVILGVPRLYINVNVVGPAFNVHVDLSKDLHDPFSDLTNLGATWNRGRTGTTRNPSFLRQTIAELMDEFIDEYLRVNEGWCR